MPEWLVEKGIGETRAALIEGGRIIEARIELEGTIASGTILVARLESIGSNGRNALAKDEHGHEYLLPHAPRSVTEGAPLHIEVLRTAIPGVEPWKRPLARQTAAERRRSRSLAERLRATKVAVRELAFPDPRRDELGEAGWGELLEEAAAGEVRFAGGSLGLHQTPAMILVDVDGHLPAAELAVAGAAEAARAIRRLDIGGSIGIDLPTVAGKGPRLAAAAAIDAALAQPFERTAVNGFGFVQLVRPRERASLLELWADRPAAEARALLRRAAFDPRPGAKRLVVPPPIAAVLEQRPDWLERLAGQVGGAVALRAEAALPISGGHAEPA